LRIKENLRKIPKKTSPVDNSTNIYCQDILLLHNLHLPENIKKENIGMRSNHFNLLPHKKHIDLPFIERPVLYLNETTFRKLPIIIPNIK